MAWTSLLLLACWGSMTRRWLVTAATLFALTLTRETSILIAAIFVFYQLMQKRFFAAGLFGLVTLLAIAIIWNSSATSAENIHQMTGAKYLLLKFGFNGLRNLAGITLWIPTFSWDCTFFFRFPVNISKLIGMKDLAICEPNWPLEYYLNVQTLFGIGPTAVLALRKSVARQILGSDFGLSIVWTVGLLFFLLAPVSGASQVRLISHSFPLFCVALPLSLKVSIPVKSTAGLISCHLALTAISLGLITGFVNATATILLLVTIANAFAYKCLSKLLREGHIDFRADHSHAVLRNA
jgi:hypothetical protein